MKPRLTLVTHVDWGHIRQRSHHLAVALSAHYDVTVISPVSRKRAQLVDNPAPGITVMRLWRVPGSYRSAGVAQANAVLAAIQCGPQVRRASVVVVTSPELWPWVSQSIDRRTLVYDCMDDALAFVQDEGVRALKAQWERDLIERSDVIACSSEELAGRAIARGAPRRRTVVVQNGWDAEAFPVQAAAPFPREGPVQLVYFGTVASWLDFDALRAVVSGCAGVSMRLIGPLEDATPRDLAGIILEPPVEHRRLARVVDGADALLLPFRVSELTRAVDPVKLYEYIALGKPILASHWPAIDRFAAMVTFYRDAGHLVELVRNRELPTPADRHVREAFLAPQSWQARGTALRDAILRHAH